MASLIFQRYLGRSIVQASSVVMCAFLAMFLFFDFLAEIDDLGPAYTLGYAFAFVLLGLPSRSVEIAPIAVLIGTLWALSQSAVNSEFTVFRVSGLLPKTVIRSMFLIGFPMVLITTVFSEVVSPVAEQWRSAFRETTSGSNSGVLRSGLWLRDTGRSEKYAFKTTRFINAKRFERDQKLSELMVYEFDEQQRLIAVLKASSATHIKSVDGWHDWMLRNTNIMEFQSDGRVSRTAASELKMTSMLSPEMLGALITNPDRMNSFDLYQYIQYLKQNKQQSDAYEIALWKRVAYPFAIWVMMALALPVAFLQARSGAVGARVFAGILVGIGFHLLNSLFSHLGVLTTWPAPMMVLLPSIIALMVAAAFFHWVQRR